MPTTLEREPMFVGGGYSWRGEVVPDLV